MDELAAYHPIACLFYPNNCENNFRESCSEYNLAVFPGHYWPLRSYTYTGSVQALIYFPLFRLFQNPWSARFLGLLLLAAQSLVLSKIAKVPSSVLFLILLLFFPYSFCHIVDDSPISLHCFLVFAIVMMIEVYYESKPLRSAILIGFLVFVGIASKLTFFWLIPALTLYALRRLFVMHLSQKISRPRLILSLAAVLSSGLIPSLLLLFAKDRAGNPYRSVLNLYVQDTVSVWTKMNSLSGSIFNAFQSAERIFPAYNYDTRPWCLLGSVIITLLLIFLCLSQIYRKKHGKYPLTVNLLANPVVFALMAFLLTYMFIADRGLVAHHIILAFPFLLIAIASALSDIVHSSKKRFVFGSATLLIFALSLYIPCWARLFSLIPMWENDKSRFEIQKVLSNEYLSSQYAYIIVDWGMYYLQSLYGNRNQMVLYIEPFDSQQHIEQIRNVLRKTHRKALFVFASPGSASDLDLIRKNFKLVPVPGAPILERWQALMEPPAPNFHYHEPIHIIRLNSHWKVWTHTEINNRIEFRTDRGIIRNKPSLKLVNHENNHSMFYQDVSIKGGRVYKISGWIRTKEVGDKNQSMRDPGASLGIKDTKIRSIGITGTKPPEKVAFYVKTLADQIFLTVACQLGSLHFPSVGTAWFDDVQVEEIHDGVDNQNVYEMGNLVQNPGFEIPLTLDDSWQTNACVMDPGFTEFRFDISKSHRGNGSALIDNRLDNDSRLVQEVNVLPNQVYRVSGWISTSNIHPTDPRNKREIGACLCIEDTEIHSRDFTGTHPWQYVEFLVRTTSEQTTLPIACRLGYWSSVMRGKAWFDDISVVPATGNNYQEIQIYGQEAPVFSHRSVMAVILGITVSLWIGGAYLHIKKRKKSTPKNLS